MPTRNVVRNFHNDCYYHVYNRGHNKEKLFIDDQDYNFFLSLLQRCFGPAPIKDPKGRELPWFGDMVSIHAYCLMRNHFHLLLYQGNSEDSVSKAMQSLGTTYSMYFNKKYSKRGTVFESVFKASPIYKDEYLQHITRYIHLNPTNSFKTYLYSSYRQYVGQTDSLWLMTEDILSLFDSKHQYIAFVNDYEDLMKELSDLKYELADYAESI